MARKAWSIGVLSMVAVLLVFLADPIDHGRRVDGASVEHPTPDRPPLAPSRRALAPPTDTDEGRHAMPAPASEADASPTLASSSFRWGDYDRDGLADALALTRTGHLRFLRSRGDGSFDDVTADAYAPAWRACSFSQWDDVDGDGWTDLVIGTKHGSAYLFHRRLGDDDIFYAAQASGLTASAEDVGTATHDDGSGHVPSARFLTPGGGHVCEVTCRLLIPPHPRSFTMTLPDLTEVLVVPNDYELRSLSYLLSPESLETVVRDVLFEVSQRPDTNIAEFAFLHSMSTDTKMQTHVTPHLLGHYADLILTPGPNGVGTEPGTVSSDSRSAFR